MRDIDRIQELESILRAECPKYENDCNSCPYNEQCNEYARLIGSIEDCNEKCIELNTL